MKWTRASEIPNDDRIVAVRSTGYRGWWFYDHSDKVWRNHNDGCGKIPGWLVNTSSYLDESPESSVWPGDLTEAQKLTFSHIVTKIEGIGELDLAKWLRQWLQSRTAVKAETRKWNEELNHWEPYAKAKPQPTAGGVTKGIRDAVQLFANKEGKVDLVALQKRFDEFFEKETVESFEKWQKTAGGVKEEYTEEEIENVLYYLHSREDASDKGIYEQLWENQCKTIKEQRKRIKELESQPSPSNPSIKEEAPHPQQKEQFSREEYQKFAIWLDNSEFTSDSENGKWFKVGPEYTEVAFEHVLTEYLNSKTSLI